MPEILFRADGSSTTGLGHLYRCCALAEILGSEFSCTLYTRTSHFNGFEAIAAYFDYVTTISESLTAIQEIRLFAECQPDIVVLDGYDFDTIYQKNVRSQINSKLVCVDDIHAYEFLADVIINHAGGVTPDNYASDPEAKLFLGVTYAIIRPGFGRNGWGGSRKPIGKANSILITYGAADPNNQTGTTLDKLLTCEVGYYDIHVVIGAANRHKENLLQQYGKVDNVQFHHGIDARQMLALMQESGICIASPSTVSLEYLNSSGGTLVSDPIADNQRDFFRYLVSNAFSLPLETFLAAPVQSLQTIDSDRLQQHFDGMSSQRLYQIFSDLT